MPSRRRTGGNTEFNRPYAPTVSFAFSSALTSAAADGVAGTGASAGFPPEDTGASVVFPGVDDTATSITFSADPAGGSGGADINVIRAGAKGACSTLSIRAFVDFSSGVGAIFTTVSAAVGVGFPAASPGTLALSG
jgi:hypothetical protein